MRLCVAATRPRGFDDFGLQTVGGVVSGFGPQNLWEDLEVTCGVIGVLATSETIS